jgi:hypothetical protein
MTALQSGGLVAECFWPGVTEADVEALDARVAASAAELRSTGHAVEYLGSILLREDEVVLCQFEGTTDIVLEAARRAQIPFERLLESARSRWPVSTGTTAGHPTKTEVDDG